MPRAAFQTRLVPVLDQVLDQLEADPDARFLLDGQTILLEDYLAIRPEQEPRIRAQVERGALEIGPWYVLADLLVPSAHSIRRNLIEGRRAAERFGKCLDVLYSPDAFGHPAALPAIAAELGFRRAVIRRGLGRPGDFYRWESPDGASLLTHQLPPAGYDDAIGLAGSPALPTEWRRIRQQLIDRASTPHLAVFLGADHHAMVPRVSVLRDRLAALEPGGAVRISGLGEYFDAVEGEPPVAPVIRGSLRRSRGYTWDLQDTHSARARLKAAHGAAELRLARVAEPLDARIRGGGRSPALDQAWKILLQSQFHDTLAGTTCDEAQQEQALRIRAVNTISREVVQAAVNTLLDAGDDAGGAEGRLLLWNPVKRKRAGVVTAMLTFFRRDILVGAPDGRTPRTGVGAAPFGLRTAGGQVLPVQVLAVRRDQERRDDLHRYPDQDEVDRVWIAVRAPKLPGLGLATLQVVPSPDPADGPLLVSAPDTISNELVAARTSPEGSITLADRTTGTSLAGLLRFVDEPDQGDLYTCSPGGSPQQGTISPLGQAIHANGSLIGALETRWSVRLPSGRLDARMVTALQAGSSLLTVRIDLQNPGPDHRLRLAFPAGRGKVIAGGTVGLDLTAPVPEAPPVAAIEREVKTAPAQRFVAAQGPAGVLAVFAPGFFEYEWTPHGVLLISVLRGVGELTRDGLPERPGHAAWPVPTPEAQEPGQHRLELALALLPLDLPDLAERLEQLWEEAFLPVQSFHRRLAPRP